MLRSFPSILDYTTFAIVLATRRPSSYQRRNFTLRAETADLLDRLPREVNRSKLVDAVIHKLVRDRGRAKLRKLIEEGATYNAERDLRLVEEWFAVDAETWPGIVSGRRPGRAGLSRRRRGDRGTLSP